MTEKPYIEGMARMRVFRSVLTGLFCAFALSAAGKSADSVFVVPEPNFIDYLIADEAYEDVIRITSEELTRHPKDGRLYSQRAVAYIQQEEVDKALADISKAIRYYPSADKPLAELYRLRGILYEYNGQIKKAEKDYRRAQQ